MGQARDSVATEVEWQFSALDVRPVARWLETHDIPGYMTAEAARKLLRDTYYDTEDWRVHGAGFTLRVRIKDGGAEATMKSMSQAVGGLRRRTERTELIDGEVPADLRQLPGGVGDALRSIAGRRPLRVLFAVETDRRTVDLSDEAGHVGEIALDTTTVPVDAEDHPVRFSRVEVEVESVERAQVFVDALVSGAGLMPATTSKFQAALIATDQAVPASVLDLGPTDLGADMSASQYGMAVLRRHYASLVANEAGTRLGEDPEFLHDMRVASRRIRATLSAFDAYLPIAIRRLRSEMGWLTRSLGEVRDLDVQLEQVAEWRTAIHGAPDGGLDQIEAVLSGRRAAARRRMTAALDSRRTERLLERFAAALRRGVPRTAEATSQPVLAVVPGLVRRRYRRLTRAGDRITSTSPPADYHALRIEAKKLRYACEFAAPLYGKPANAFAGTVTELQDLLGLHQDADVGMTNLLALSRDGGRRLGPAAHVAVGMIAERYGREAAELRKAFPRAYRRLGGKRWRALDREFQRLAPREQLPIP